MRFRPEDLHCPECGAEARGTLERLSGVANFLRDPAWPAGTVEYEGGTDIFWDDSQTDPVGASGVTLLGFCGHDWTVSPLSL